MVSPGAHLGIWLPPVAITTRQSGLLSSFLDYQLFTEKHPLLLNCKHLLSYPISTSTTPTLYSRNIDSSSSHPPHPIHHLQPFREVIRHCTLQVRKWSLLCFFFIPVPCSPLSLSHLLSASTAKSVSPRFTESRLEQPQRNKNQGWPPEIILAPTTTSPFTWHFPTQTTNIY